jgi:hypothetical protein
MKEDFKKVRSVLEALAAQTPAEPASPVDTHDRGTSSAICQDIGVLVALYDYGFIQATESSASGRRELTSPALTADGRDLLDALRNATMWARVEDMAATQGVALSLGTAMAAVAAALTGGFNS